MHNHEPLTSTLGGTHRDAAAVTCAAQPEPLRLLLLCTADHDSRPLRGALRLARTPALEWQEAARAIEALRRLRSGEVDLALIDLPSATDALRALTRLVDSAPHVPVVVVLGIEDEARAADAVRLGAQDCLLREHVSPALLARTVRCAVERHRRLMTFRDLSLTDPLTGLYNRRGFWALAEAQLRLVRRTRRPALLLCADLDGLKRINDRFGHPEGDRALIRAAHLLRASFRESDLLARTGGDEFAALAHDIGPGATEALGDRITRAFQRSIRSERLPFRLSLSLGSVVFTGEREADLGALIAQADEALYRDRRRHPLRRAARSPDPLRLG